jgi:hypothetical protein
MGTSGANTNNPSAESDDEVEEIEGCPQDSHQHIYVWHHRGDHWASHEEIAKVEKAERVEHTTKCLVSEVKVSPTKLK